MKSKRVDPKCYHRKKNKSWKLCEMMDMLLSLIVVNISPCIPVSNYQAAAKCIQLKNPRIIPFKVSIANILPRGYA